MARAHEFGIIMPPPAWTERLQGRPYKRHAHPENKGPEPDGTRGLGNSTLRGSATLAAFPNGPRARKDPHRGAGDQHFHMVRSAISKAIEAKYPRDRLDDEPIEAPAMTVAAPHP